MGMLLGPKKKKYTQKSTAKAVLFFACHLWFSSFKVRFNNFLNQSYSQILCVFGVGNIIVLPKT